MFFFFIYVHTYNTTLNSIHLYVFETHRFRFTKNAFNVLPPSTLSYQETLQESYTRVINKSSRDVCGIPNA